MTGTSAATISTMMATASHIPHTPQSARAQ
jgi:hypothetical protein